MERVETERLVATRPLFRDADELHPLLADPAVADWLWPGELGGPRTLAQTRTLLVGDADHWKRHGFGPWILRDADGVVGRAGLRRHGDDEVEVLWLIAGDRWGRGYATEAARAAIACAFGPLGLRELVSFTVPHNAASRAVMERCGFRFSHDVVRAGMPHVFYRLQAPGRAA